MITELAIALIFASLFLALGFYVIFIRFNLRPVFKGRLTKTDRVYLIFSKRPNRPNLFRREIILTCLSLIVSRHGKTIGAYVNGHKYQFDKTTGLFVKEASALPTLEIPFIDCGLAKEAKIASLDALVGQKWSLFNNCFMVFARWRKGWH